jgi:hypothetical protein
VTSYAYEAARIRAARTLDALDAYDEHKDQARLLAELDSINGRGDDLSDAEVVLEAGRDAAWDRAEAYREEHGEWPRQDRYNRDSGRYES